MQTSTIRRLSALLAAAGILAAAGCSDPDQAATADGGGGDAESTLVLLDSNETGYYSPVSGYGRNGDSPVYEGLYKLEGGDATSVPEFIPNLASGPATASEDFTTWTVPLRTGITFSDGSTFGPEDVAATYNAIIDERSASPEIASWENLEKVEAKDNEVVFHLKEPFAEFDRQLMNGIAPSEYFDFGDLKPDEESPLNEKPVGTGPYVLSELRADQAVFTARPDYRNGEPDLKKIIYRVSQDENSRAQQMAAGEGDGTILEPKLAEQLKDKDGLSIESADTADWRGITLPSGNPVTGDDAIRMAVNLGVDRKAMVDDVLDGHGSANSTFFAPFYGDAYDPAQEIAFDPAKAEKILDDAGWKKGADGVRVKDGQRAAFDVIYFPNRDKARMDLTLAAASDLKKIGIEVNPVARDSKSVTEDDYAKTPIMLGGGGDPYTVDTQIYTILHSKFAKKGVGAKWDNASDYVNPKIDELLDKARVESDEAKRDDMYREIQKLYAERPAMLQLAYVNHVYVERDRGYSHPDLILEPHAHGMNFGPWYDLGAWKKK